MLAYTANYPIISNDRNTEGSGQGINRRTVLKGAAVGAGIYEMSGLATAGDSGDPCFKYFECSCDATYVKSEFVEEGTDDDGEIETCYFEEDTDTGFITIDSYTSKDGEDCEPISVEWSVADGYGATKVMAYGGQDCVFADEPDPDESFEPGLEGPGGETAAINNLQFCVEELVTVGVTVDCGNDGGEITVENTNDNTEVTVTLTDDDGNILRQTDLAPGESDTFDGLADGDYTVITAKPEPDGEVIGREDVTIDCDDE